MRNKYKAVWFAAALVACFLSSCSTNTSDLYNYATGKDRTLPEGSNVNFGNRHAPPLNNVMPTEDGDDARDVYSPARAEAEAKTAQ